MTQLNLILQTEHNKGWIDAFHGIVRNREDEVRDIAGKSWRSLFNFDKENESLTIGKRDQSNSLVEEISELVETLRNLNIFDKCWRLFCNKIWSAILSKSCSPQYSIQVYFLRDGAPLHLERKNSKHCGDGDNMIFEIVHGSQIVIQAVKSSSSSIDVNTIFRNVTAVLSVFDKLFSNQVCTLFPFHCCVHCKTCKNSKDSLFFGRI